MAVRFDRRLTGEDYEYTLNFARNTTHRWLFLAILFSFLTVAGSGSVACGDFVVAPRGLAGVQPNSVVLGIEDHLDDFARGVSGRTWKQIVTEAPETWLREFRKLLYDGKTKFTFNLDGVDVWGGVSRASRGAGGYTDLELLAIKQNPDAWSRITWVRNGEIVPNPFQ